MPRVSEGGRILFPPPKPQKGFWFDIWEYDDVNYPFQIFIGPRGPGKTYSALKGMIERRDTIGPFVYSRRTREEVDDICDAKQDEFMNPFSPINKNEGWNLGYQKINKNTGGLFERVGAKGNYQYEGESLGLLNSMFSIGRSSSFDNYNYWIYDEFIPDSYRVQRKGEGTAPFTVYETACRNREFEGREPMRLWMIANSENIWAPVFQTLGIVDIWERMAAKGYHDAYIPERKLALHLVEPSQEFTQKKSETSLARLMNGTSFYNITYKNQFGNNDFSLVTRKQVKGMFPICRFGEGTIYRKKGERRFYVSYSRATHVDKYSATNEQDIISFRRVYGPNLLSAYLDEELEFESYALKELILNVIVPGRN